MARQTLRSLKRLMVVSSLLALCGCIADEVGGIFMVTHEVNDLLSVSEQGAEVQFQAGGRWRAWTTADWLGVTPSDGESGRNSIIVWTVTPNRTRQRRSAQLVIESDGKQESLTVWQRDEFALFDSREYHVGVEGGLVDMRFSSNIPKDSLLISYYPSPWIGWLVADSMPASTRTEVWNGRVRTLQVEPNNTPEERVAIYILITPAGERMFHQLDTAWVRQDANPDAVIEVPSDSTATD